MELSLLNIGFSQLNADWNWQRVYSPFARIYYVADGEARTRIGDRIYSLKPGHMYITPPFTLHDDECDSPFSLYYIHFFEQPSGEESVFDIYTFPAEVAATTTDLALIERLLAINPERHLRQIDPGLYDNMPTFRHYADHNARMPQHTVMETRGILMQILSRFIEHAQNKTTSHDIRIRRSLAHIHRNIGKSLSIAQLAQNACLSTDHFIRMFRRETGRTPLEYILARKIEKAQLLLMTTHLPVKEIAIELSIENISYFNRIFKRLTGYTPGEYRQM